MRPVAPEQVPASVLVIDDDEQWTKLMQQALRSLGCTEVRCLTDPSWSVQIAAEFRPDLVFLDLRMHSLAGDQVLCRLHQQLPRIPVVIVTGIDDVDAAVLCMHEGAVDYLTKPLDRARLVQAIDKAMHARPTTAIPDDEAADPRASIRTMPVLPQLKEAPDMLIDEAMDRAKGVVKDAATMLGVSSQAICNRRRRREEEEH
jgi:DNA-binding NtrC family response regulator